MSGVDLKNITLYEIAKEYGEESVIGDFRRPMWQRFATIALSPLMKNPKLRPYALQLSNMVKLIALMENCYQPLLKIWKV